MRDNGRDREMNRETDSTIRQIEFEPEKAGHGMGLPYDAERKLSAGLTARRRGDRREAEEDWR
jgi:hypothetical protein